MMMKGCDRLEEHLDLYWEREGGLLSEKRLSCNGRVNEEPENSNWTCDRSGNNLTYLFTIARLPVKNMQIIPSPKFPL